MSCILAFRLKPLIRKRIALSAFASKNVISKRIMDGWKIALIVVALKLVLLAFCLGYRYKKRQVFEKQRVREEAYVQDANQQIVNWIDIQSRHDHLSATAPDEDFEHVQDFQPPKTRADNESPPNYWSVVHETNR